jgi:mannose-6-phosphate isomerase-like protein (cupin superfamily)
MKKWICSSAAAAALLTASLVAQQKGGAPAPKLFSSSADVQALIAAAKAQRTKEQPLVTQRILALAPYNANLEYRASVGTASVHETEAEMFYVIEGSATLVTGGKLVGETRNGENLTGSAIEGGNSQAVAKGDFIMVPEKTAHWFSKIDQTLVLMSIHVPRK